MRIAFTALIGFAAITAATASCGKGDSSVSSRDQATSSGPYGPIGGTIDPPCPDYDANVDSELKHAEASAASPAPSTVSGTVGGAFDVSPLGAAQYTIPITVPPGRNGMEPSLALSYSSAAGHGLLGHGFTVSGFSVITRCPSTLTQDNKVEGIRLDHKDNYCLDGLRLIPVGSGSATIEYRTYPDTFARITAVWSEQAFAGPTWFRVEHKSGRISEYGNDPSSRVTAVTATASDVVREWWINKTSDRYNNSIIYQYDNQRAADGHTIESVPSRILYTDHPSAPATRSIDFVYHDTSVLEPPYVPHIKFYRGGMVSNKRVVERIEARVGTRVVKAYSINYGDHLSSAVPLVANVVECADGGERTCKPATWFKYQDGSTRLPSFDDQWSSIPFYDRPEEAFAWTLADVNGDGLPDIVHRYRDLLVANPVRIVHWMVALNRGGTFDTATEWATTTFDGSGPYKGEFSRAMTPVDIDDDGKMDILIDQPLADWETSKTYRVLRSNGSSFEFVDTGIRRPQVDRDTDYEAADQAGWMTGDLDADGKDDFVTCYEPVASKSDSQHVSLDDEWVRSKAKWKLHRWTPTGNAGKPGFDRTGIDIPPLTGMSCWTMGRYVQIIDWDADGQNDIIATRVSDQAYVVHKLNVPEQTWSTRFAGVKLPGIRKTVTTSRQDETGHVYHNTYTYVDLRDWYGVEYAGTGHGYTYGQTTSGAGTSTEEVTETESTIPRLLFPDLNGDGYPDLVHLSPQDRYAPVINTGVLGFLGEQPKIGYFWPIPEAQSQFKFEFARVFEAQGDGRNDILVPSSSESSRWTLLSPKRDGQAFEPTVLPALFEFGGGAYQPLVADINGDGLQDIVFPHVNRENGNHFRLLINKSVRPLLTEVTDGTNPLPIDAQTGVPEPEHQPTVKIVYGSLLDGPTTLGTNDAVSLREAVYRKQSPDGAECVYPVSCAVGTMPVVKHYYRNSGQNTWLGTRLRYRDGRYHRTGRGFLGFASRFSIGSDAILRFDFYDNATYDETLHDFPFAGRAKSTMEGTITMPVVPSKAIDARVDMTFTERTPRMVSTNGGKTYFTYDQQVWSQKQQGSYRLDGAKTVDTYVRERRSSPATILIEGTTETLRIDEFGNVLDQNSTIKGQADLETVSRTVTNNTTNWLLGLIDQQTVCSTARSGSDAFPATNQTETQCRKLSATYTGRGAIDTARRGDTPETDLVVTFRRDQFGNAIRVFADDDYGHHRNTCTVYEPEGVFPTYSRNGEGHGTYVHHEPGFGAVTGTRDPNDLVTLNWYDGFGQLWKSKRPDGTETTITRRRVKDGGPSSTWWRTYVDTIVDGSGKTTEILDSLGRVERSERQGPSVPACGATCRSNALFVTTFEYDTKGRMTAKTGPYIDGDTQPKQKTSWVYDNQGRIVKETAPWGAVTNFVHDSRFSTATKPGSETSTVSKTTTTTYYDYKGRQRAVVDAKSGETTFSYGPFDAPRTVTTPFASTVYWIRTDPYGRQVELHHPDSGVSKMIYDGFGDLMQRTDGGNRVSTFEYDKVGRRKVAVTPEGQSLWIYDIGVGKGVGAIARASAPNAIEQTYTYDTLGRRESVTQKIGSESFKSALTYDSHSRPQRLTYPAGPFGAVYFTTNGYDATGRLNQITDSAGRTLWQLERVDQAGRTIREDFNNSAIETNRTYDPQTGMLTSLLTDAGTKHIQNLAYGWDVRLNLKRRTDVLQAKTEHFGFDELDRLGCSWIDGDATSTPTIHACGTSYSYRPNGNIEGKSDVGTYQYLDAAHPHAVTNAGGLAFGYDAVGNQTSRPGWTVDYTSFNLPWRYLRSDGTQLIITYDAHGRRVRKDGMFEETTYFQDLYERIITPTDVKHRYFISNGERKIATLTRTMAGDDVRYLHVDHLGSPDVWTDGSGDNPDRYSYSAFGERRNPTWGGAPPSSQYQPISIGFTGHEAEDEIGLVNAKGRIYDPQIGRFLSIDAVVEDPAVGQTWNPYSYVRNNPVTRVDPNGWESTELGDYNRASEAEMRSLLPGSQSYLIGRNAVQQPAGLAPANAKEEPKPILMEYDAGTEAERTEAERVAAIHEERKLATNIVHGGCSSSWLCNLFMRAGEMEPGAGAARVGHLLADRWRTGVPLDDVETKALIQAAGSVVTQHAMNSLQARSSVRAVPKITISENGYHKEMADRSYIKTILNKDGYVEPIIDVAAGSKRLGVGTKLVQDAVDHYGTRMKGFDMMLFEDNLDAVKNALKANPSLIIEEAVLKAPTYKQSAAAGFTKLDYANPIVSDGELLGVHVRVSR